MENKIMIDFFIGNNIVACRNFEEVKGFLSICRKSDYKWLDGSEILPHNDSMKFNGCVLFGTSDFGTNGERRICYTGFDKTKYVVEFSNL